MSGISTDSALLICTVCVFTHVEDLGGNTVRARGINPEQVRVELMPE